MQAEKKIISKIFEDFVPPPSFLKVPVSGIEISDRKIRFVEFGKSPSGYFLKQFGEAEIPEGAITDGYVNKIEVVQPILEKLKEEKELDYVNVSLPEEKAFLFKTQIPVASLVDINSAVEFKIEENVPFSPSEAVFDYKIIGESPDKQGVDVGVAVLPLKTTEAYLTIVKGAGLNVMSFNIESQAIAKAVIKKEEMGTVMILNIKEKNTGVYIINDGVIHFTSNIPIGGKMINDVIQKSFAVSKAGAFKLKETNSFLEETGNMDVFSSIVNTVSAIQDEIKKLFIYWKTHSGEKGQDGDIHEVILCGRDGGIEGFVEYLSANLGVKVSVANAWQNIFDPSDEIPQMHFLDSLDYLATIGSALPND